MKEGITLAIVSIALVLLPLIGEVLCIYKAVKCNWEPVGKAEMVYTVSAITGLGCIVGYIDIQDK
jgi:hypothetical protein